MSSYPCLLFLINKCFYKGILTVCHYANEEMGLYDFTSVRIYDVCRITCPINFNLFTRFSIDMHSCTTFLLILLNVVAELRVHKGLFVIKTTFLHVLCPEEFFGDPIFEQFFLDVDKVKQSFLTGTFTILWVQQSF